MTTLETALLAFLILVLALLLWQIFRLHSAIRRQETSDSLNIVGQWISEMKEGIDRTNLSIQQQMSTTREAISSRMDATAHLMRLLNKDLGQIHEIGQQMRDFQHLFRSPKLRGNIGENILKEMLLQILPNENVLFQYRYKNGQIVDAVISAQDKLIPIDAKFPMENFSKAQSATSPKEEKNYKLAFYHDIKKHVKSVSQKYISPDDNTVDFVLLYIPSETIYYDVISHSQIPEFARRNNVLIISPNSFYYFLKIIMMGLEGQKIEEASLRIINTLKSLQKDAGLVNEDIRLLTGHLNNSKNAVDRLSADFSQLAGRLSGFYKDINRV